MALRALRGAVWSILGGPGVGSGRSWVHFGLSWGVLGRVWTVLGDLGRAVAPGSENKCKSSDRLHHFGGQKGTQRVARGGQREAKGNQHGGKVVAASAFNFGVILGVHFGRP